MLGSRHENARLQSDFYRDQFRKMLRFLFLLILLLFVMLAGVIYLILFRAPEHYYANTSEGKIMEMPKYKIEKT